MIDVFERNLRLYMRCVKAVRNRDIDAWDPASDREPPKPRSRYDAAFDHCRELAGQESITHGEAFAICYGGMDG